MKSLRLPLCLLPCLLWLTGCDKDSSEQPSTPPAVTTDSTESGAHDHPAPHDGTMIQLGEHFANLEFVLNDKKGELHAWFHDAHAQRSVRLPGKQVPLAISLAGGVRFDLLLKPVASVLTGETIGDTSLFSAKDPRLVGVKSFEGLLTPLRIQGRTLPAIGFEYPSGKVTPLSTGGQSQ